VNPPEVAARDWYLVFVCDIPRGSVTATIFPPEESIVRVTANLGSKQEVGEYRHKLPSERGEALRAALRRSDYASLPQPGPATPGSLRVFIGEGVPGALPTTQGRFPSHDIPPALLPFMQAVGAAIEEIREHPYRVLAAQATFEQPEVTPDADVVILLTLRARGKVPAELFNPAGALEDDRVGLILRIAADKPSDQLQDDDVAQFELGRADVVPIPRPGARWEEPATKIELRPEDEMRVRLTKKLRLRPGRYNVVIIFTSVLRDIDPERGVEGTLTINPGTLTVRR
jgi:hypothetical protein